MLKKTWTCQRSYFTSFHDFSCLLSLAEDITLHASEDCNVTALAVPVPAKRVWDASDVFFLRQEALSQCPWSLLVIAGLEVSFPESYQISSKRVSMLFPCLRDWKYSTWSSLWPMVCFIMPPAWAGECVGSSDLILYVATKTGWKCESILGPEGRHHLIKLLCYVGDLLRRNHDAKPALHWDGLHDSWVAHNSLEHWLELPCCNWDQWRYLIQHKFSFLSVGQKLEVLWPCWKTDACYFAMEEW